MMKQFHSALILCVLAIFLTSCTTVTESEFQQQPFEAEQLVSGDYLTVYRRTLSGARLCTGGDGLDNQLYEKQGYGEIYQFTNVFDVQPLMLIRVEKSGSQALVKVKTSDALGRDLFRRIAFKWANGYRGCSGRK